MQFSRYEIMKVLGKGSMGIVYLAHDPRIDRHVALKVLREDRLSSHSIVYRFMKEAKAIGRLSHPGIVTVYDVGQEKNTVYIAMEFIEGESLDKLAETRVPNLREIIKIGIQVADTLDYAHSKGVVHRDIKPSNLILRPDGIIKITDFGIAHLDDPAATQHTQAGEILGTPAYMSPEQVMSQPVDGRSDLYSLGVILYEFATGGRPFKGDNLTSVLRAITMEYPREPAEIQASIPRDVSQVIMKCLSKEPEQRYPSGKALSDALTRCLSADEKERRPSTGSSKLKVFALATSLLLIATLSSAFVYWKGGDIKVAFSRLFSTTPSVKPAKPDVPVAPPTPPETVPAKDSPPGTPVIPPPQPASTRTSTIEEPRTPPPVPDSQTPPLEAKAGRLNLESNPPGASVFIDGSLRGQTPLSVGLKPGKHEVKIAMEKHYDWKARVLVDEGEIPINVKLAPVK